MDGTRHSALVDTGCSRCVAHVSCCKKWRKENVTILTISGKEQQCEGTGVVCLQLSNGVSTEVKVFVVNTNPLGFPFILGMNGVTALGGVTVSAHRKVRFGVEDISVCAAARASINVNEKDFSATYDTARNTWTAAWKWSGGEEPGILQNRVEAYTVPCEIRAQYEEEVEKWIKDGWLVPHDECKHGPPKGLIPLMAVVQHNKGKVRPVLDFRELNTHIDTFTADSDVCADKLREWRKQGINLSMVDLKKAYLQTHIHESLWPYQTVVYKGCRYCLTRLGFGLNVAPLIMKTVLNSVLSQDLEVKRGTSAYIDDVLVNEEVVTASRVVEHLERYGLVSKAPECVVDGARILGLRVWGEHGKLYWGRDGWDDPIIGDELIILLEDIMDRVGKDDPVRGRWDVTGDVAKVWVDASSLAMGAMIEVDGDIIEDATWLRPNCASHINMAELDAVIKGLNLVLAWHMKRVELMTDSSTVWRWINDGLTGRARLKTKAASEMLIRRRIDIILSLVNECGLALTVTLVPSIGNRADALTRVPQSWLKMLAVGTVVLPSVCAAAAEPTTDKLVTEVHHSRGHPGVKRTLYFAKRVDPAVTKAQVRMVVSSCQVCQSVDPAPVKWRTGNLSVEGIWQRVGMDITHCRGKSYLTLIDCGPSRFTIWRPLRIQTSECIAEQLETVFFERGSPDEILTDNDTAFRSKLFTQFASRWNVHLRYRGAYVPAGNGVVERCHRTVKVIAARKGCSVAEAVYLYNITPLDDWSSNSTPANMLYRYSVRVKGEDMSRRNKEEGADNPYQTGEEDWVKQPGTRCDQRYKQGIVTGVVSDQVTEIDGVPRHIRDIRHRIPPQRTQDIRSNGSDASD
ncbi:hypothetical protein Pmani_009323 [Petrolisthes manimaculis]|uniref:Integrase catalytic domain-containing protein n=1 Tax=Petrolisthes manimaculis TaxID=1843537 RepID=A0AAE1Q4H8_9EUCA|nr:hypothetical protein Pmani_009323 [Petrolisthes manimaculis]